MVLDNDEFKSAPRVSEKLRKYGIPKSFQAGEIILNDKALIRAFPIVLSGNVRVMHTDEECKEILLY